MIWAAGIFLGLVFILLNPSEAISRAKGAAGTISLVTLMPFVVTFEHCRLLCGGRNGDEDVCRTEMMRQENSKRILSTGIPAGNH
jgi:hypothetical protein